MGVPSFYRWLVRKYPNIVVNAVEEKMGEDGVMDTTKPNPNGMEFDNLYLDMNCIIHPCFHPEHDLFPPTTYDEVFSNMFEYMDRLFRIVRPRKLLYMAVDGVAPRAKMNQQRARRFQAAKDAELGEVEEEKLRREFELEGKTVLPKVLSEVSDATVITPGTIFMDKLSKALKWYIYSRLNNDPGWRDIKVILSDANVPGEGEHKIMSFIRKQRRRDGYDPNTRHCLYGLDADLIILALATHEIHFSILREGVTTMDQQPSCTLSLETSLSKQNRDVVNSRAWFGKVPLAAERSSLAKMQYRFLNIWTLREYLELDMTILETPKDFVMNFERIIDDFVFLCIFVGNDFLPHLPSLEIHEGAIDLLMAVYKAEFKNMGGYLVDTCRLKDKHAACIKFKRVERLILVVGSYEDKIFKKRSQKWQVGYFYLQMQPKQELELCLQTGSFNAFEYKGITSISGVELKERKMDRIRREMSESIGEENWDNVHEDTGHQSNFSALDPTTRVNSCVKANAVSTVQFSETDVLKNTKELMQRLKDLLRQKSDLFKSGILPADKVRYGSEGWKGRYYKAKFSVGKPDEIESKRKEIVQNYAEGLCWILRYYYEGVCSWSWYYSHHYGPFASDFKGLAGARINFQLGTPFKPFTQLMAVLPRRSAYVLPEAYRILMTSLESNIKDFYPIYCEVDTDCKQYMWQGVTLLEFIDEKRLLLEIGKVDNNLKDEEAQRNSFSHDMVFVRASHDFGPQVSSCCCRCVHVSGNVTIDCETSGGLNGFLMRCDEFLSTDDSSLMKFDVKNLVCAIFENPMFDYHIPEPPKNVTLPEKTITEADLQQTALWHEDDAPRPRDSRLQNRPRHVPEVGNVLKPNLSGMSSARETWRVAGSGWRGGRGRGRDSVENLGFSQLSVTSPGIQASSGGILRPRGGFRASVNGSWNSNPQQLDATQYGVGRGRANVSFGTLRFHQMAGTSQGVPVGNGNFHVSSNGSRDNMRDGWRNNWQATAQPSYRGRGRDSWRNNSQATAEPSYRGRGRSF